MRRASTSLIARLARCAASDSPLALGRTQSLLVPALATGLLSAVNQAAAAANAGHRQLHASAAAAAAATDSDYNCVFYPDPEAEVGEPAPAFSLPGARGARSGRAAEPLLAS